MRGRLVRNAIAGLLIGAIVPCAAAHAAGSNPNETVDTTPTATAIAQTLVGPGVAISNVQYTGAPDARGTFAFSPASVVGMSQGVILSSGNAHDSVGPNTSDSLSTDWLNPGDADLTTLSGFPTFDAAVLEFDFIPAANQVSFQYAFASDEYSEFVNTQYNDVFAFFINGVNCAVVRQVPGDPASPFVPVAVNNINNSNPGQIPPPPAVRPDLFRANDFNPNGPSVLDLEQDGITRVITCQSAVNPGVTNHMKLAIADASDGVYDSVVFIQAGSLVSNENPTADLGLHPSQGAAPLDVTATVEGHDPNGLPLTYTIDWGDGASTPSQPLVGETAIATHTYTFGGEFIVTLTVSNGTLSGTDHDDVKVSGAGPICGDGLVQGTEQCDEGAANGTSASCCSAQCQVVPGDTACDDDGNACTLDVCDGSSPVCQHPAGNAGALCRPSAGACDPAETCDGSSPSCPADVVLPDSDGDGVCDATDVCTNIGHAQDFAATAPKPKLIVRSINTDPKADNDGLTLLGAFVIHGGPAFSTVDPATNGARIVVESAAGTPRINAVLPGGTYTGRGSRGWKVNKSGKTWTYVDASGAPFAGITGVTISDKSRVSSKVTVPGRVQVKVTGKKANYPVVAGDEPVKGVVVLGGQAQSEAGYCGETAFGAGDCAFNRKANTLTCRK